MLFALTACAWLTPADLAARLERDSDQPGGDTAGSDTASVDSDCATTWYADVDGDQYGDESSPTEACEQPDGHVAEGGDCDDSADSVNPDGVEVCGNGVDENCLGGDQLCLEGEREIHAMGTLYGGASTGDQAGFWVRAGDYDADGQEDWVTSAPFSDASGADAGAVYVMDGTLQAAAPLAGEALAAFVGGEAGDFLGHDVAFTGSFDADCDSLAFGGPGHVYGSNEYAGYAGILDCGLLGNYDLGTGAVIAYGFQHTEIGVGLGNALAGGLDYSDHPARTDDLAIGGPGYDGRGAVWVVFSEETNPGTYDLGATGLSVRYDGDSLGDYAGYAVGNLADHTGDGFDDLGVGATGATGTEAGKVHVVAGGASSTGVASLSDATLTLHGERDGDQLGYIVENLGDLDGDGLPEFATSSIDAENDAGVVYVIRGTNRDRAFVGYAAIEKYALGTIRGLDDEGRFGTSAAAVDIEGDGQAELLVGATEEWAQSERGGAVYVFHDLGAGTWSASDASAMVYRDQSTGIFGSSLAEVSTPAGGSRLLIGNMNEDGEASGSGGVWAVPLY